MSDSEPTPVRAGHRGNRDRIEAKLGADLGKVTPEDIRQADTNLRRPRPSTTEKITEIVRLLLPPLIAGLFGSVFGYGTSHDSTQMIVIGVIGGVLTTTWFALEFRQYSRR